MATRKAKSPIQQMVRDSLQEIKNDPTGRFDKDPELNEDGEVTGPARFAKTQLKKDEVIVDRLLAPIAQKEGYFLKLKKEVRIGEWMLMKVIKEEWRKWADLESSISDIVREHTKHAPLKWGTGNYRVEFACDGGVRGDNYKDRDFPINAEEELLVGMPNGSQAQVQAASVDPNVAVAGQIDTLANLVGMLKNFLPPAADPSRTQAEIASAFKEGMALSVGGKKDESNVMATMMTGMFGMMTALMTQRNEPRIVNPSENDTFKGMLDTLKTFGLVGQNNQVKEKTVVDFITELKALGMDLFEKKDPIQQIGQLKQLASIAGEFMGMGGSGEKPGILEKIVDTVGPMIPGIVRDIKETASNAVAVQVEAGRNIERARLGNVQQEQIQPGQGNTMNVGTAVPANNAQVQQFFNGLYEAVLSNNRAFYPIIYTSLLQDANGQNLLNGIVNETHTAKELIELLQSYGGDKYRDSEFVMKKLVGYTNGFIIWVRELLKGQGQTSQPVRNDIRKAGEPKPSGSTSYDAECQLCGTVYAFENEQEYNDEEDKSCEVMNNGVLCPGLLKPLQIAS